MVWPALMQLAEKSDHDFFVGFVEVPGGLIGQDQLRLIDQRPRNRHALLLSAGKLRRQMRQAVAQSHALQRFRGLPFVRDTVKILRQHHVFERVQIGHQVKLLKHEADLSPRGSAPGRFRSRFARSTPSTTTWPDVSVSSPPRILISVVLPEPEGPISATHSPA